MLRLLYCYLIVILSDQGDQPTKLQVDRARAQEKYYST